MIKNGEPCPYYPKCGCGTQSGPHSCEWKPACMRTREEHLQWAKDQAMADWHAGNMQDAVATMVGRLNDHPETKNFSPYLLALGIIYVNNCDIYGVRRWIEGFR